MKKLLFIILLLIGTNVVLAAPSSQLNYSKTIIPETDNLFDLGTSTQAWRNMYTHNLTITGTCTGCGGGGGGNVATSTPDVANQVLFYTSTGATPATVGGSSNMTWDNPNSAFNLSNGSNPTTAFIKAAPNVAQVYLNFQDGGSNNDYINTYCDLGICSFNMARGTDATFDINEFIDHVELSSGNVGLSIFPLDQTNTDYGGNNVNITGGKGNGAGNGGDLNLSGGGGGPGGAIGTVQVNGPLSVNDKLTFVNGTGTALYINNASSTNYYGTNATLGTICFVGDICRTTWPLSGIGWASTTAPNSNSIFSTETSNVGIGTTSPYAKLSVVGSTGVVADIYNATNTVATSTFQGGATFATGSNGKQVVIGNTTVQKTNELLTVHYQSASPNVNFGIGNSPSDVNFYRIGKETGGQNSYIDFTNSGITMSGLLTTSITGAGTSQNTLNVGPAPTGFHTLNGSNVRTTFNAGTGNVNAPGGNLGGDLYFQGGDTPNSDSGIVPGNVYIEGGFASAKSPTIWGNVFFNGEGTGLIGFGTSTVYSRLEGWGLGTNTGQLFALVNNASTTIMQALDNGNIGFGTTTPYATTSIQSGSGLVNTDAFVVATTTKTVVGGYDNDGHRFTGGYSPNISSCGTGSPTVVGDDNTGTITTGTAATSCTMTFAKAYRLTPVCNFNDDSTTIPGDIQSISTTAVTFALGAGLSGGHLYYQCSYHHN